MWCWSKWMNWKHGCSTNLSSKKTFGVHLSLFPSHVFFFSSPALLSLSLSHALFLLRNDFFPFFSTYLFTALFFMVGNNSRFLSQRPQGLSRKTEQTRQRLLTWVYLPRASWRKKVPGSPCQMPYLRITGHLFWINCSNYV